MISTNTNFSHLDDFDLPLAQLGAFAERYFVDDPNPALMKTRQYAERFFSGTEVDPSSTLPTRIRTERAATPKLTRGRGKARSGSTQ